MAVEEDLSEWEIASTGKMFSYAFGYLFINFLIMGGFSLVFYYYEVELGVSVLLLGLAYVIFAIWNMINDPLLGYLTDRPLKWTKKWGLRAPCILISGIPILLFYFLIWVPPEGASEMTIFIWFIVITCLFDTFFSIYNDHVYGGYTNQFPSEYERRRSFAIATILMGILMTVMGVIGNAIIVYGDRDSFITYATIMILFLAIYHGVLILGIKESDEMKQMFIRGFEKAEKINFFRTMKIALKTKNFRVSLAGYTCWSVAITLSSVSGIYMFKDVWQLPLTYAILPTILGVAAFVLIVPFWSNYTRKHGFKKTYWLTFICHGICILAALFVFREYGFPLFYIILIIIAFIGALFYSGEVTMLQPVASDTYDLVASKVEKRVDATLVGVRTFFFRVAFVVVGILIPVIHILTGYNPDPHATQTLLAQWGIRIHAQLIPGLIFIVMGLIFKKYYTLEGAEKEALVRRLKELGIYR